MPRRCAAACCRCEQLFTNDAVIWTDLASRALTYGVEGGPALDVAFPDMAMLGLWQVPGAYICIEPWAGHADPKALPATSAKAGHRPARAGREPQLPHGRDRQGG
jgi:hypothetical protein